MLSCLLLLSQLSPPAAAEAPPETPAEAPPAPPDWEAYFTSQSHFLSSQLHGELMSRFYTLPYSRHQDGELRLALDEQALEALLTEETKHLVEKQYAFLRWTRFQACQLNDHTALVQVLGERVSLGTEGILGPDRRDFLMRHQPELGWRITDEVPRAADAPMECEQG